MAFLKERETNSKELMDSPECDKKLLFNTYKQFVYINKFFSGWKKIYLEFMLPYFKTNNNQGSILDVGCGGGDILLYLNSLAKKDGITLELHGIDPDPSALDFINTRQFPENITFQKAYLNELVNTNKKYDFVINNNVIHHLTPHEFINMLHDAELVANKMVIFNDVQRSTFAWVFFKMFAAIFCHNSLVNYDGCLSIKKGYTEEELQELLSPIWEIKTLFPYRNLIFKTLHSP